MKYRYSILNTGSIRVDAGIFFGGVPAVTYRSWPDIFIGDRGLNYGTVVVPTSSLLVEMEDFTILVDTGYGNSRFSGTPEGDGLPARHSSWKLMKGLRDQGIRLKDIDKVVLTSLSWDHAGGVIKQTVHPDQDDCVAFGGFRGFSPMFPNAEYFVPDGDGEVLRELDTQMVKGNKVQVHRITSHTTIAPGVEVRPFNGYLSVVLRVGGERIIVPGDLLPTHFHLLYPDCNDACDNHRGDSLAVKQRLIHEAISTGSLMFFCHGLPPFRSAYLDPDRNRLGFTLRQRD